MNGKVILVTGPPASGKSTLANALVNLIKPLQRISAGQVLLEHKRKTNPALTYEDLRVQSSDIISAEDIASLDSLLVAMSKKKRVETNILIDSHAVTKESYGFRITSFHQDLIAELNLDAIIVLNCKPEELVHRIQSNPNGRRLISLDEARHHMQLQETLALLYGVLCGCPTFIVNNNASFDILIQETIHLFDNLGMVYQHQ